MTLRKLTFLLCLSALGIAGLFYVLNRLNDFSDASAQNIRNTPPSENAQIETEQSTKPQLVGDASSSNSNQKPLGGPKQPDFLAEAFAAYNAKDQVGLAQIVDSLDGRPLTPGVQQLLKALELSLAQNVEAALQLLHSAANDPVAKPIALACAGELLFQLGDMQNAEPILKAALIEDPNQPNTHRYLAAFYYDVGAMDNALLHLEHVGRLDPEDARPWRMRGVILSDFERHSEAIEAYSEALKRDLPPHVKQEVSVELAESFLATRQPAKSLDCLADCAATAQVESLRADCHLSLGDYASASASLTRALKEDPNHPRSLMIQATLSREQGDLNAAKQTLEKAVQVHPYEFDFRAQLMSVLAALGDAEGAQIQRDEMQRLQGLRTKFTELHHESMRDPNSPQLRYELGQTAEKLGKWEMAVSWYQAALSLDPEYSDATEALQALVRQLQKP